MNLVTVPSRAIVRWLTTAASLLLFVMGGALSVAPSAAANPLPQGAEIDASSCAYGPGQLVLSGNSSGQYLSDTESFYALAFLPANAPGGHFRFRDQYPRASWMSYQAYDATLATQGVVDDLNINPDPGSSNPFLPGHTYQPGHVSYTVDVENVPPAQRTRPAPPNVLYAGYRMDPSIGGLSHTPNELVLYQIEDGTGPSLQGGVPTPRLYWVVDHPQQNVFQSQAQVCAAMRAAALPWGPLFQLNSVLDKYVWAPILTPALMNINLPSPLDLIPQYPPDVSVFRPSTNGYSWPLFNEQTPYIFTGPSALFGQFIVIRFKAPTTPRVEQGIPSTGNEQTQYWSWCSGQLISVLFVTSGCLADVGAHADASGYVTLVVSPANQRPSIGGKPYADWIPWPASGPMIFMSQIDPNPKTFPQSPYFLPPTRTNLVPYLGDWFPGIVDQSQIRSWMGAYFPQVSYCSQWQFQLNLCAARPTP